ncbi:MAG: hypothetical protein JRN20_02015 [Nitrososphaerota archaeon]|nr:hypothetical protein [Nitrososphaerota archaeon]MDG6923396.1 hypothetical protein [Nitrososphaerota archaeon]
MTPIKDWYRRFRGAAYVSLIISIIWTVMIVLPFKPFSYLPPIIAGASAGVWFIISYVLFLVVGVGGFGTFSGMLHTIEVEENRSLDSSTMWLALVLLGIGLAGSCALLAIAGAIGGYDITIAGQSGSPVREQLSPYVYPTTATILTALAGAALTLAGMLRAR